MIPLATIYRFYTPFVSNFDKYSIFNNVKTNIEDYLNEEGLILSKVYFKEDYYGKTIFNLSNNFIKLILYFQNGDDYKMPLFFVDIFLKKDYSWNESESMKNIINFLTWLFECFDWMDEKDFIIDYNKSIFYLNNKKTKIYPIYDFTDADNMQDFFNWFNLDKFLLNYEKKSLDKDKLKNDENLYKLFLYLVYIVFLMNKSINQSYKQIKDIDSMDSDILNYHIKLAKKRLSYVRELSKYTYDKYILRLETLFRFLD